MVKYAGTRKKPLASSRLASGDEMDSITGSLPYLVLLYTLRQSNHCYVHLIGLAKGADSKL